MGSAVQSNTVGMPSARRVGPAFLGCALAAAIFAWGVLSGSVPMAYQASGASVGRHPLLFWGIEAFWLLAALAAGLYGVRQVRNVARGVSMDDRRARHGGLPESLHELVNTHRVPRESVPRLLAELRPSLRPSDYYPMLHHHVFEWTGAAGGFIFMAVMCAALTLQPELSKPFVLAVFGAATLAFVGFSVGIPVALRKRRREQMDRIFAAEALHVETRKAPKPIPIRVPRPEPIDSDGRELRCTSPNGRYVIYVHPQVMQTGQWVYTPELMDSARHELMFYPRDSAWSLESAVWQTASLLSMRLRRYPGDHAPIGATFDCASRTAHIDGIAVEPFTNTLQMERALKEAYESGKAAGAGQPRSETA